MNAYFIELKGCDLVHAVEQVQAAEQMFRKTLENYVSYFRIVTSITKTHDLNSTKFRHFQQMVGKRLKYSTNELVETL